MLNYVAFYLVFCAAAPPGLLQAPGSDNPKSPPMKDDRDPPDAARATQYNLHLGFVLVLVAVAVVWWLLNRSTLGFRFRAVGENPHAARVAGINVERDLRRT